ncbi:MAG: DMT family transporter [Coriobacteriia bacterium]|nr:DMT family transporter [Coriobacteriia bacterium]
MTPQARRLWVTAALIGVAAVWGGTFVLVKDAVERYPLWGFLGLRFSIAVVAFVVLFPRSFTRFSRGTAKVGILAGLLLTAGYVFQTWGLQGTTASKAAFITGMFVVITPLMQAVVLRHPPRRMTLLGVVLAVGGLWLLSGASANGWTHGDTRVLLCAVAYAAHMIVLGSLGTRHDVTALTLTQLGVVAVVCVSISLAVEQPGLPTDGSVWFALVLTGVLASAVAFAVQTYAQRYISPTKTALVLVTEPAFGGLFGWLAGDYFGIGGLAGSALILGGMILAELVGTGEPGATVVHEPALEGLPVPLEESVDRRTTPDILTRAAQADPDVGP